MNKNEYQREYYQKNLEKMRAQGRARYQAEKEKRQRYSREYYAANPKKIKEIQQKYMATEKGRATTRDARLLRQYGLPKGEYDRLLAVQGGVCAICGGPPLGVYGSYHLDHDHITGRVRGLLCQLCNNLLGACRDDTAILGRAASYLEKSQ